MKIAGLQKLTLLDFPGKVACTVFTNGCNYRCPYCHNASLVLTGNTQSADAYLDMEEITDFLEKRKGIIDGVVITGGEPTIQRGLEYMLEKIRKYDVSIKLDTNGSNPEVLRRLIAKNFIDYIAMDIKNSPSKYGKTAGLSAIDLDSIKESVKIVMESGKDYEFRTTLVKGIHEIEDIEDIAQWISGAEKYFLQQFKDSGDLIKPDGLAPFSTEEMNDYADAARQFVETVQLRGI